MHAWAEVCYLLQSSKSLLTQASYAVLAEESLTRPGFLQTLPHTNSISNSAILRNNYISLLSDLCACVHVKKYGVVKEAIVLQWAVQIASWDFKPGKKRCAGALLSEKCCCFVQKPSWESCKFQLARLKKKNNLDVWRLSGSVLLRCILAPLGVLFVIKTLEDVITAYKLAVLEILRNLY